MLMSIFSLFLKKDLVERGWWVRSMSSEILTTFFRSSPHSSNLRPFRKLPPPIAACLSLYLSCIYNFHHQERGLLTGIRICLSAKNAFVSSSFGCFFVMRDFDEHGEKKKLSQPLDGDISSTRESFPGFFLCCVALSGDL